MHLIMVSYLHVVAFKVLVKRGNEQNKVYKVFPSTFLLFAPRANIRD